MNNNHTTSFCISPYLVENNYGHIVERSILWAMKKMYSDGVLNLNPINVEIIDKDEVVISWLEKFDK